MKMVVITIITTATIIILFFKIFLFILLIKGNASDKLLSISFVFKRFAYNLDV